MYTTYIFIYTLYFYTMLILYIFLFLYILHKTLAIRPSLETYRYYTYFVYFNNRLHYIHKKEKIGMNNKLNYLNGIN